MCKSIEGWSYWYLEKIFNLVLDLHSECMIVSLVGCWNMAPGPNFKRDIIAIISCLLDIFSQWCKKSDLRRLSNAFNKLKFRTKWMQLIVCIDKNVKLCLLFSRVGHFCSLLGGHHRYSLSYFNTNIFIDMQYSLREGLNKK